MNDGLARESFHGDTDGEQCMNTKEERRSAASTAISLPASMERSYQAPWRTVWPIARTGLMLVLRRRLFWFLLALGMINFLFLFATIYLKAELSAQNPAIARFVDRILDSVSGEGRTYRDFMFAQGTVTMLLLGLAGEMLVGNDFRHGGLVYYLSRRLGRRHYLTGKLLASLTLVGLITTLPALILFVQYGLLTKSFDYFWDNWSIVFGILGYGLCMGISLSLVLFALAAWLQRTVPLLMAWAGLFLFLPVVGALLREIHDDRRWYLLNLWRNIRLLGTWCFGGLSREQDQQMLIPAMIIVSGVCLAALLVSIARIRAVRVVT